MVAALCSAFVTTNNLFKMCWHQQKLDTKNLNFFHLDIIDFWLKKWNTQIEVGSFSEAYHWSPNHRWQCHYYWGDCYRTAMTQLLRFYHHYYLLSTNEIFFFYSQWPSVSSRNISFYSPLAPLPSSPAGCGLVARNTAFKIQLFMAK